MNTQTFTFPAGRYVLGDACHWIKNIEVWTNMVNDMCDTEVGMVNVPKVEPKMEDEKYDGIDDFDEFEKVFDKDYEEWEANPAQGQMFYYNTHADGVYEVTTEDGEVIRDLISDTANISLIPVELCDTSHPDRNDLGMIINSDDSFEVEIVTTTDDEGYDSTRMVINNQIGIDF